MLSFFGMEINMRVGWIGAGKVGCSLGKYFAECGIAVSGYYSRNIASAREAAGLTGSKAYESVEALALESDVIFLTVPDNQIAEVWEQMKNCRIHQKIVCHCSGALSSEIFSDREMFSCEAYSVHPLLAIHEKGISHQELSKAMFTIEGTGADRSIPQQMIQKCGNHVIFLQAAQKMRYHAAAVIASNLVCGLLETASEELKACGFSEAEAQAALAPLMQANVNHLVTKGPEGALTGPVERGDADTVEMHLRALGGDNRDIYTLLSKKALSIAKRKHPDRDYKKLEDCLD